MSGNPDIFWRLVPGSPNLIFEKGGYRAVLFDDENSISFEFGKDLLSVLNTGNGKWIVNWMVRLCFFYLNL